MASCSTLPSAPPTVPASAPQWTVNQALYDVLSPGKARVDIMLESQQLRLVNQEGQTVIQTDCSTGVAGKETPRGRFTILEKIQDKRSNLYGRYVSVASGEVIAPRSWLVSKPAGTRFEGTPMPYWMRLTWSGVGIHVGSFPRGQTTSMGCIRVPEEVQPLLYAKATIGMPVRVQ